MKRAFVRLVLALGAILACLPAAHAQTELRYDYLGLEVGVFFPSDSLLRDRFGDSIVRVGIAPVFNRRIQRWQTSYEIGYIGASEDGDRFSVIPVTVGLQRTFGDLEENFVPFVRGAAGIAYVDYDINDDDGRGFSPTAVVEAGFLGGDRLKLSARYSFIGEQDDISFSGFSIGLSYGIIRF